MKVIFKSKMKTLFIENDIYPSYGVIQLNIMVFNFFKTKRGYIQYI